MTGKDFDIKLPETVPIYLQAGRFYLITDGKLALEPSTVLVHCTPAGGWRG
jgi:hypothetical protein